MSAVPVTKQDTANFMKIRVNSLVTDYPLPVDVYLSVNRRLTLFRRRGEVMTLDRLQHLKQQGVVYAFIPAAEQRLYQETLNSVLRDPSTAVQVKGRVLKESAFLHMQELFAHPELGEVFGQTKTLVENMVEFVSMNAGAVSALVELSSSDSFVFNHSVNVAMYAVVLAKQLFPTDRAMLSAAALAGLMHDIGKRNLEPTLLDGDQAYTAKDILKLREHPLAGEKMLKSNRFISDDIRFAVAQHHEHFDGTGYPRKLSGLEIGRMARLVAIADNFDALTVTRHNQAGLPPQEAIESMAAMEGRFDPQMFHALQSKKSVARPRLLEPTFDPCHPQPIKFRT